MFTSILYFSQVFQHSVRTFFFLETWQRSSRNAAQRKKRGEYLSPFILVWIPRCNPEDNWKKFHYGTGRPPSVQDDWFAHHRPVATTSFRARGGGGGRRLEVCLIPVDDVNWPEIPNYMGRREMGDEFWWGQKEWSVLPNVFSLGLTCVFYLQIPTAGKASQIPICWHITPPIRAISVGLADHAFQRGRRIHAAELATLMTSRHGYNGVSVSGRLTTAASQAPCADSCNKVRKYVPARHILNIITRVISELLSIKPRTDGEWKMTKQLVNLGDSR